MTLMSHDSQDLSKDLHKVVWKYTDFSCQENTSRKQLREGGKEEQVVLLFIKETSDVQYTAGSHT